jgi:5-dehydro-2-deoxygluconokinase
MLGLKIRDLPLIFTDNCADMALTPDDISEDIALLPGGNHPSHANTRAAVLKALEYAPSRPAALDIDYRAVGLAPRSAMAKPFH